MKKEYNFSKGTRGKFLRDDKAQKTIRTDAEVPKYKLPDLSVNGKGLHPDVSKGKWADIRKRIYKGRGE